MDVDLLAGGVGCGVESCFFISSGDVIYVYDLLRCGDL